MNFKRSERVRELLRHEISLLVQNINDPRLGFVTITSVALTDDLYEAKVYYSVFGNDEDRKTSSEILIRSVPSMRHELGKKLESLRRVPTLFFVYDETPMRAQKVTLILEKLARETGPDQPEKAEKKAKKIK